MSFSLLVKFIAGVYTAWLALIWSKAIAHPAWLPADVESLMAIPAAVLWFFGFWEDIKNSFKGKNQDQPSVPSIVVHNTIRNTLKKSPTNPLKEKSTPRLDTSNRRVTGPNDPILTPWLGKPLHGREKEINQLVNLLKKGQNKIVVLGEGGVGKTEVCKAVLRRFMRSSSKKVWYINVEKVINIHGLWQRLAGAIDLETFNDETEVFAALPEGLYYLDNLESLDHIDDLANHLRKLSQKPGIEIIASSRSEVPGWGENFDISTLPLFAATNLFREIWDKTFATPIPSSSPQLDNFVEKHLGCLPLAIVIVAALGNYENDLNAVCERWIEEGITLGKRPNTIGTNKLDSLETSIRLSLKDLPPAARALWGIAAFFPPGIPASFLKWLIQSKNHRASFFSKILLGDEFRHLPFHEGRDLLISHRILHKTEFGQLRISPPLARFALECMKHNADGFSSSIIISPMAAWQSTFADHIPNDFTEKEINDIAIYMKFVSGHTPIKVGKYVGTSLRKYKITHKAIIWILRPRRDRNR